MPQFKVGQRIRILAEADCAAPPPPSVVQRRLSGRTGVVTRLRRKDAGAWVRIDGELDKVLGDEVLVFPGDCRVLD